LNGASGAFNVCGDYLCAFNSFQFDGGMWGFSVFSIAVCWHSLFVAALLGAPLLMCPSLT
jgi:hypothetical protein